MISPFSQMTSVTFLENAGHIILSLVLGLGHFQLDWRIYLSSSATNRPKNLIDYAGTRLNGACNCQHDSPSDAK